MAEAAVEDRVVNRFFCHICSCGIPQILDDYTCPTCLGGFIEELEDPSSDDTSEDDTDFDLLGDFLFPPMREARSRRSQSRQSEGNGEDDNTPGRPGGRGAVGANARVRDLVLFENMIQDFIVNLTGVGWGPVGPNGRGNGPVFFLGNPGDYAWGREGLDAIVTQLLNQMDGAGPPPLDKEKIKEIPTVNVSQEHVDLNLQCSVCWEDFKIGESVRKLQCEHLYHEPCIIPWLELHGTCPICRKTLSAECEENSQQFQPTTGLFPSNLLRNAVNSSQTSSTSSSTSSSSISSGSSLSTNSNDSNLLPQPPDYEMELE